MPAVAGFRGERAEGLPAPPAAAERRTLSLSGQSTPRCCRIQTWSAPGCRTGGCCGTRSGGNVSLESHSSGWCISVHSRLGRKSTGREESGGLDADVGACPSAAIPAANGERQLNQERAKIAQVEWTAVAAAMRSYFDLMYKQGSLDLARESAELGKNTAGAVNRRFTAGLASPAERITSNVAARRSQRRAELAEADYRTALKTLRDVLNSPPEESVTPSESLGAYRWLPVLTGLGQSAAPMKGVQTPDVSSDQLTQLTATRPDVEAARYRASAARAI